VGEAMVTGRMAPGKKRRGALVLQREGINASQAINRMYDRIIEDGNAEFLTDRCVADDESAWARAAEFVDSLCTKRSICWPGSAASAAAAAAGQSATAPTASVGAKKKRKAAR
jgi:antitoxin component of RelBE/YafQ-DinJ toxin-antitoxin module